MSRISASLLAADFGRLGEAIAESEAAGVDRFHLDVMDGHFVPNLTFGPVVIEAVRKRTDLPLEAHAMVQAPERFAADLVRAGADLLAFHLEATPHPHRLLEAIRSLGAKAGIAVNPGTPVEALADLLELADQVLLMSVNPGFAGQRFIERTYRRLEALVRMRKEEGLGFEIAVDGGVKPENAGRLASLGADVLVAASGLYNDRPVAENLAAYREALGGSGRALPR